MYTPAQSEPEVQQLILRQLWECVFWEFMKRASVDRKERVKEQVKKQKLESESGVILVTADAAFSQFHFLFTGLWQLVPNDS